jgi:multidrug transporter EmrE-like cation transporter
LRNSNKDLRQTGYKLRSCSTSLFIPNIIFTIFIALVTLASGAVTVFGYKHIDWSLIAAIWAGVGAIVLLMLGLDILGFRFIRGRRP